MKTEFKGQIIAPRDSEPIEFGMLAGDFAKVVFKEYLERTKQEYNNAPALRDSLAYLPSQSIDAPVGSNPFSICLINKIVKEHGLRTATPSDYEKAIAANINLKGTNEVSALILNLYADNRVNCPIGKSLISQLRGMYHLRSNHAVIPLDRLDLINDTESYTGLNFKISEGAKIILAPVFDGAGGEFLPEDVDLKIGLPSRVGYYYGRESPKSRTIYTTSTPLTRLELCDNLTLLPYEGRLSNSYDKGRIFLARDIVKS